MLNWTQHDRQHRHMAALHHKRYFSLIHIHPVPWQNVKDVSVLLICESSVFDNYLLRQFIKQSTTTTVTRTMSDYTFNEWMDDRG